MEAYCVTQDHGRTALHIATFSSVCPLAVVKALLMANPHMVVAVDRNGMTPLHHICHLKGTTTTTTTQDLVPLVCQYLEQQQQPQTFTLLRVTPPSPLWYATKRGASLRTLRTLLQTSRRRSWVAPRTGGEPYYSTKGDNSLLVCSSSPLASPLNVLLKYHGGIEERFFVEMTSKTTTGMTGMKDDTTTTDNENDKNLQNILRKLTRRRLHMSRTNNTDANDDDHDHEEEDIDGMIPSQACRTIAIECVDDTTTIDADQNHHDHDHNMEIIELWEKCLELLVDHCPVLLLLLPGVVTGGSSGQGGRAILNRGIVHAVVCANLPSLLPLVSWLFPEQFLQHDEQGFLPLHHAICMVDDTDDDCSMTSKVLHHGPQEALLVPTKDDTPQTPLCLALKQGDNNNNKNNKSNIKAPLIFRLMNGTSSASIPCDGLYPFALAAAQDCDLTVIYTLLLASPHVLGHVVPVVVSSSS
jgi:hypothetical protein